MSLRPRLEVSNCIDLPRTFTAEHIENPEKTPCTLCSPG